MRHGHLCLLFIQITHISGVKPSCDKFETSSDLVEPNSCHPCPIHLFRYLTLSKSRTLLFALSHHRPLIFSPAVCHVYIWHINHNVTITDRTVAGSGIRITPQHGILRHCQDIGFLNLKSKDLVHKGFWNILCRFKQHIRHELWHNSHYPLLCNMKTVLRGT